MIFEEPCEFSSDLGPEFVRPRYDGFSIANIPGTVGKLLGAGGDNGLRIPELYSRLEEAENLVVVIMDGMGVALLRPFAGNGRTFLGRFLEKASSNSITSVFPSTTSTSIATLHTGLLPSQHGIIGYTMYLPELGTVLDMLNFSPIVGRRMPMLERDEILKSRFARETVHQRMLDQDIGSYAYMPEGITGSGLSRLTLEGAGVFTYTAVSEMFVKIARNINAGKHGLHYAYLSSPDSMAHWNGPHSAEFATEVEAIFYSMHIGLLQTLNGELAGKTGIIITADHGHIQADINREINLYRHRGLHEHFLRPPTGDAQAASLHLIDGREASLADRIAEMSSAHLRVETTERLVSQGYFGPGLSSQRSISLGNLYILSDGEYTVEDNLLLLAHAGSDRKWMMGRHGGLTRDEMIVPFIYGWASQM